MREHVRHAKSRVNWRWKTNVFDVHSFVSTELEMAELLQEVAASQRLHLDLSLRELLNSEQGGIVRKIVLLLSAVMFVFALSSAAQNTCLPVRGIAQEHLLDFMSPDWQGGYPGAPWVGPVQLILGDNEILVGKVSENDGAPRPTGHQDVGGYFVFDFGTNGAFTVKSDNSVFPPKPKFKDASFTGTFHGAGPVGTILEIPGTGRFANATGNFSIKGDFMAWDLNAPIPSGRFNASISGFLCNVTP